VEICGVGKDWIPARDQVEDRLRGNDMKDVRANNHSPLPVAATGQGTAVWGRVLRSLLLAFPGFGSYTGQGPVRLVHRALGRGKIRHL